jgi:hypothetical protein
MNSRMDEDLAWLRVQDMQREAENRRLMAGSPWSGAVSALSRLILRSLAKLRPDRPASRSAARPIVEPRHHA